MPDLDYLVAPASDERCLGWLGGSGEIEGVDVVIVDPPKKGLEPGVLSALTAHYDTVKGGEPSKDQLTLIYLSCGWDALKKEMAALMEARWRLVHSRAFLFFPGTDAIETLAIFKR